MPICKHVIIAFHSDSVEAHGVEQPDLYNDASFPYDTVRDIENVYKQIASMNKGCSLADVNYLVIDTTQEFCVEKRGNLSFFLSMFIASCATVSCMRLEEALPFAVMGKTLDNPRRFMRACYKENIYDIVTEDGKTLIECRGRVTKFLPIYRPDGTDIDEKCIKENILPVKNKDFAILFNPATIQSRLAILDFVSKNISADTESRQLITERLLDEIQELKAKCGLLPKDLPF